MNPMLVYVDVQVCGVNYIADLLSSTLILQDDCLETIALNFGFISFH